MFNDARKGTRRARRSFPSTLRLFAALLAAAFLGAGVVSIFAQGPDSRSSVQENVPVDPTTHQPFVDDAPEPSAPNLNTYYMRLPLGTFVPHSGSADWTYVGGACRQHVSGTSHYVRDIQLPQGALVDYVQFFFRDDDPTGDLAFVLQDVDSQGNFREQGSTGSQGTPGRTSVGLQIDPPYIVDNENWTLITSVTFGGLPGSLKEVCSVSVRYQFGGTVNLPAVLNGAIP